MGPDPSQPRREPQWGPGKHDWRNDTCVICLLERQALADSGGFAYRVRNGAWSAVLCACRPRLLNAPIEGLLTSKQACERLGISYATFISQVQMRRITPAAVTPQNAYLWGDEQLAKLAGGDPAPDTAPKKPPSRTEFTAYAVALGHRIRQARENRRLTQQALSQSMGIDVANLRRYEKGRANITLDMLLKIANALEADLIIDFTDTPLPPVRPRRSV